MAYEEFNDVPGVKLGGFNKKANKPNPTEIEGYYLRKETRPDRFNPESPQDFYVFLTSDGEKGVYGKSAGIKTAMKKAVVGVMTKLVATDETLDTGKGNPMKVFKIYGDRDNTIEPSVAQISTLASADNDYEEPADEEEEEYVAPPASVAPAAPRASVNAAKVQQTRELLRGRR